MDIEKIPKQQINNVNNISIKLLIYKENLKPEELNCIHGRWPRMYMGEFWHCSRGR